jgi:hypothetical protein
MPTRMNKHPSTVSSVPNSRTVMLALLSAKSTASKPSSERQATHDWSG